MTFHGSKNVTLKRIFFSSLCTNRHDYYSVLLLLRLRCLSAFASVAVAASVSASPSFSCMCVVITHPEATDG